MLILTFLNCNLYPWNLGPNLPIAHGHNVQKISTLYTVPPSKISTLQKILVFKWLCHQRKKHLCIPIKQPGALFYIVGVLGDNILYILNL